MIGELATDDHGLSAGPCVASMRDPERRLLPFGVVLFALSRYSLIRPKLPSASDADRLTDGAAGVLSGALGGATGFAGIILRSGARCAAGPFAGRDAPRTSGSHLTHAGGRWIRILGP
jgi:hypothetical protein